MKLLLNWKTSIADMRLDAQTKHADIKWWTMIIYLDA